MNLELFAHLRYEQAGLHHHLGNEDDAVAAASAALSLYADIDPTRGVPSLVEPTIRAFREEYGDDQLASFEQHIGHTANARSFLALMLAYHRGGPETETVGRLGRSSIETLTELKRVSRTYGPNDLRQVVAQVNQAQQLLQN